MKPSIVLAVALTGIAGTLAGEVPAHGSAQSPVSRSLKCYQDGGFNWPADGSGIPNAACRLAFQVGGNNAYPFFQWMEVSANIADYRNPAALRAAIPDGKLCSAGDLRKRGLDAVSPAWHRSVVRPVNHAFHLRFRTTVDHVPSYYEFYLSKPGRAGNVLAWDDLELIHSVENAKADGNIYDFVIPLPPGRSGDAVLYTRWQRIDPVGEGFYACSDITIEPST